MKVAYICDYCGDIFPENVIRQHEENCDYNPKNKTCFTCRHCITDYGLNIKCGVKNQISVSILNQDILTRNCDEYNEGYPTKIIYT